MSKSGKLIVRSCPDYENGQKMREIVREGLAALDKKPRGNVLLKPNLIFAHKRYGVHGYTNPALLEAVLDVLAELPEVNKITIGERTAVTVPTRYTFYEAGYGPLLQKPKVEVCFYDEARLTEVPLEKGTVHRSLHVARELADADFKVWMPKLKHHASSKLTASLKLNMGILDSKERLQGHDYRLEEKIADLYEVGHPDLVVCDAVDIGQQAELVPRPLRLGVIIMGNTGVAVDALGARLIGFDSAEIDHLRIARERGYPPVSDDELEIDTDVPVEELMKKTRDFDRTFSDPTTVDTPIRFYQGNYPDGDRICDTGCNNMIKTSLAIMEAYSPGALKKARPVAVVMGEYEGDVDGQGMPVLLIGDCAKVKGEVKGKTRRIGGCPVVVPYFMNFGCYYFKTPNPYLDPSAFWKFPYYMAVSYINKLRNRTLG